MNLKLLAFATCSVALFACGNGQSGSSPTGDDSQKADSLPIVRNTADTIPLRPSYTKWINRHHRVMDSAFGYLNRDHYEDAILVLRHDSDDVGMMSERPRPVLLLIGSPVGFKLAEYNEKATLPQINGQMFGEPFNGIEIDSGSFTLKHYGGSRYRWTRDFVFVFDKKAGTWKYDRCYESMMDMLGEDPSSADTIIAKQKVPFGRFSYLEEY